MPWGETQDVPIILVAQSHWKDSVRSLNKLHKFIDSKQKKMMKTVRLSSGHTTSSEDARRFISKAIAFIGRIVAGDVPVIAELAGDEVAAGGTLGNETFIFWLDDGGPLFSLLAPERFKKEF